MNGTSHTTDGQGVAPPGTVFLTRDCVRFRTVKSPLAVIASKFFTLLSGESALSSAARRCFAHALLDHPVDNSYNATIDSQIRQLFLASPPQVTLIQGAFRVDYILEDPPSPGTPKSVSTVGSSLTTTNGPTSLLDSVFASFTLHNEVLRCQREDKEQFARLSAFFLAALAHETSHWLFTRSHGFRRDEERQAFRNNVGISQAGQNTEDPLIALGQRPQDSGTRTVDMLLGWTPLMVSFADGDTEVVKRKVQPAITNEQPVIAQATLEELIGAKLPKLTDITGQSPILIGGTQPSWSTHDAYLVTSQTATNSFCSHGACRIGQLFG